MDTLCLHNAVKQRDVEKLKELLATNAIDINAEDDLGVTALIEACIIGDEEIVMLLLEAGCPAQPPAGFRHSPLRGTTVCGQAHLIPILLKYGADPNALSEGNRTPLMGACFLRKDIPPERSMMCVKELLNDERTDPTVSNSFGETALDLAKVRGYNESQFLVEEALKRWLDK
mmetsp:Transcript_1930/g.2350  ORF Transcript_1930/g.2350 Transcript_1930/m.2350 type:complete len:173 (+) Transcript_1930:140-658(+)